MTLQPRALSPLRNARLQTVDSNLIFDRIYRIQHAWADDGVRFDDGLGGVAFRFTPSTMATYGTLDPVSANAPSADAHVVAELHKMVVPANTDHQQMRLFQAWAPVPRASASRKACAKQASLATLAVGIDRTPIVNQCFSIGSCVPAAKDAGALDDVYNAYAEQLQACMAADHADSATPVPLAMVLQPGTAFQLGQYQDIPVYFAPNTTHKGGYIVRFGSRATELPAGAPTPDPFDAPTPAPPSVGSNQTSYGGCPFTVFNNTTLHRRALELVTPTTATPATTAQVCGEMCALLLTCRIFVFDGTCHMYSINNIGAALCKTNGCAGIWVDDAEQECAVTLEARHRVPSSSAMLHIKSDCCIVKPY